MFALFNNDKRSSSHYIGFDPTVNFVQFFPMDTIWSMCAVLGLLVADGLQPVNCCLLSGIICNDE